MLCYLQQGYVGGKGGQGGESERGIVPLDRDGQLMGGGQREGQGVREGNVPSPDRQTYNSYE